MHRELATDSAAMPREAGVMKKRLLVVAHAPSANTRALVAAMLRGAAHPDLAAVEARHHVQARQHAVVVGGLEDPHSLVELVEAHGCHSLISKPWSVRAT